MPRRSYDAATTKLKSFRLKNDLVAFILEETKGPPAVTESQVVTKALRFYQLYKREKKKIDEQARELGG